MSKKAATARVRSGGQVIIPKEVCEQAGLGVGDIIEMTPRNGSVLIKPKRQAKNNDSLSSDDIKSLRRAMAQMKNGRTRPWDKIKDELGG